MIVLIQKLKCLIDSKEVTTMKNNPIKIAQETANLSLERVADILGVTRQTINNYSKNPGQIPAEKIFKLSSATGISIEKLCGFEDVHEGPKIIGQYYRKSAPIYDLIDEAKSVRKQLTGIRIDKELKMCRNERDKLVEQLDDLVDIASVKARKATICAFGPSDAGKSTLINYMIGEEVVPSGYSPMTTVPTYLKHVREKPLFLEENADNAVVYGRKKGSKKQPIKHLLLSHEKEEKYIIRKGNYNSILKEFGTREGAYYKDSNWEIDEIVVYVDSDFLKEVTFIDIPGFDSGDDKDNIGLAMDAGSFDIIFFLSTADAYLRGHELAAIHSVLAKREDLSSFYLLATHTNSIGDPREVDKIIEKGCERLITTMSESEKKRLALENDDGVEKLKERCFAFDMMSEKYCDELNECVEKEFEAIVENRLIEAESSLKKTVSDYCKESKIMKEKVDNVRRLSKSPEEISQEIQKTKESREKAEKYLKGAHKELKEVIFQKKHDSIRKMEKKFSGIIDEEYISQLIEDKGFKNRKADIEDLVNCIDSELDDCLRKTLTKESKDFADELDKRIAGYEKTVKQNVKDMKLDVDFEGFDFSRAFATGLTGITAYGALAVWAAIVANGSNLGAYILVAKVVSALSALGISVGGTAAAASFVASIGGPVTVGITLALIASIAAFGVFTGTWKIRVARRLIKEYTEKGVLGKYNKTINDYWKDTEDALSACIKALKEKVAGKYDELEVSRLLDDEMIIRNNAVLGMIYDTYSEGLVQMDKVFQY